MHIYENNNWVYVRQDRTFFIHTKYNKALLGKEGARLAAQNYIHKHQQEEQSREARKRFQTLQDAGIFTS